MYLPALVMPTVSIRTCKLVHLDVFNHLRGLVLQDDQLVRNHSVHSFLQLVYRGSIGFWWYVKLHLATTWLDILGWAFHNLVNVFPLPAALILKQHPARGTNRKFPSRVFWVISTMSQLMKLESMRTLWALEDMKVRPDLPVDFLPGYPVGLPDECYELF